MQGEGRIASSGTLEGRHVVTQAGMTTMTADTLSGGDWTSREVVALLGPIVELGHETEAQQGSHREPGTARPLRGEPGCRAPERFQIPRRPAPSTEVTLWAQSGQQDRGQGPRPWPSQASVADGALPWDMGSSPTAGIPEPCPRTGA